MSSFEQGFAEVQKAAETARQSAANLVSTAKTLVKAAREGDIAKIRRATERLVRAQEVATQEVANAADAWPFSPEREEDYLKHQFAEELLARAQANGLALFARDEGLVAFPSLLRVLPVLPAERALRVDRKKVTTVRPGHLVSLLKTAQAKKHSFDPARFIEVLHRAYRLLVGGENGVTVPLERVYETLTLLPGAANEYEKTAFGRDLLMLDQSGVTKTRSGAVISLPASTGTKGSRSALSIVSRDGTLVTFYAIRFVEEAE